MANLIILMGIPGSGKSTWAKTMLDRKYHIVSSDEIRKKKFGSLKEAHTPDQKAENNQKVWWTFYREIEDCLKHNVYVFSDATNLRAFARERLREIADRTKAKTHLFVFDNIEQAAVQNLERDDDAVVPDQVMEDMLDQYTVAIETIQAGGLEDYDTITWIGAVA
jgi:predicted kinase